MGKYKILKRFSNCVLRKMSNSKFFLISMWGKNEKRGNKGIYLLWK